MRSLANFGLVLVVSSICACTPDSGTADGGTVTIDNPTVDAATPVRAPLFVGSWNVVASDVAVAGFTGLTINADGSYTQTGRSDDQPQAGKWTQPASAGVDPSYGSAPAGIAGPYLELDNAPNGDGEWVYGSAVEAANGSTLTLTLYAQRFGMGLRWATVATIHLVAA